MKRYCQHAWEYKKGIFRAGQLGPFVDMARGLFTLALVEELVQLWGVGGEGRLEIEDRQANSSVYILDYP